MAFIVAKLCVKTTVSVSALLTPALLQDMLDIVDVEGKREPGKYPSKQGGFDLIWDNGPVTQFDKPTSLPTMLGCFNSFDKNQLRVPLAQLAGDSQSSTSPRKRTSALGSSSMKAYM